MRWTATTLAWRWLAHAAVGGGFVLFWAAWRRGCAASRCGKCPIIVLTLVAGFAIPWISLVPQAPRWSTGFVLPVSQGHEPTLAGLSKAGPEPAMIETGLAEPRRQFSVASGVQQFRVAEDTAGAATVGLHFPSWDVLMFSAFVLTSVGWAAWWLLGQLLLWRIVRRARPVPPEIHEIFRTISGPAGHAVVLLESEMVRSPLTFTWTRPAIVLPAGLCDGQATRELRFCLAHEWSHIERRDALVLEPRGAWRAGVCLSALFWWLRRQLRLCQDYLADDRAAEMASAGRLCRLPRSSGAGARDCFPLPALGVSDRRSNLYRRVAMLVQDHEPLEHRCRRIWSLAAASDGRCRGDCRLGPAARRGAEPGRGTTPEANGQHRLRRSQTREAEPSSATSSTRRRANLSPAPRSSSASPSSTIPEPATSAYSRRPGKRPTRTELSA